MPFTSWNVADLAGSLTTQQVNYVLDSVKREIEQDRQRRIELGYILYSLATDEFKFPEPGEYTSEDRTRIHERKAVLALWDKVCFLVADQAYYPAAISDIRLEFQVDEEELERIKLSVVEPLPAENLEVLKELVKKAALRKLKEMEEQTTEKAEP